MLAILEPIRKVGVGAISAAHAIGESSERIVIALDDVAIGHAADTQSPSLLPGQYTRVVIADNGCGMDARTLQRIFALFYATKSVRRRGRSWRIDRSRDGCRPWRQHQRRKSAQPRHEAYSFCQSGGPRGAGRSSDSSYACVTGVRRNSVVAKILVIDDDRMVRESLRLILGAAGHQLILAGDGKQGTKAFVEHGPDLVITDILMPEKEGIETICDIRRFAADVPIVAMSGGGRMGNASFLTIAERFGANRTFAKPLEPREILGAIAELLQKAA